MILYTAITEQEYEQLQNNGKLYCNEKLAYMPNEYILWKIAYQFMADKLNKIDKKPDYIMYPRWAWYMIDGSTNLDNVNPLHYVSKPNEKTYVLKLDIDRNKVLLSDFGLWHCCLNGYPIWDNEQEDDAFDNFMSVCHLKYYDALVETENKNILLIKNKIMNTWDKIFNINGKNPYLYTKNKTVQAVFWEITLDVVLKKRIICLSDEEYKYWENV